MPKRKQKEEELELYDYWGTSTQRLRYVGRKIDGIDGGISRIFSEPNTVKDPLCKLLYSELLTGRALEDAKLVCPPAPEGWIVPSRFIKRRSETD